MPGPSSSTVRVPWLSRIRTVPAGGLHFTALSSRLVTGPSSGAGPPPAPPSARSCPGARPLDDLGEVDLLDDGPERLVAGELDEVAHEVGHLLELEADVV